ncbi:PIN domain-containing protein [Candidatus Woesearchaeota archaeon]|nr:PIN domain-containing protein [Candidatus Woesearchaeota archaeon]
MMYTADTSFFIRLSEGAPKAIALWHEIVEGKGKLAIPTAVLIELKNRLLKRNLQEKAEELILIFENSNKIVLVPLTTDLAKKAGSLSYTYNMTNFDAVILATAIETCYKNVLTSDPTFEKASKQGLIHLTTL